MSNSFVTPWTVCSLPGSSVLGIFLCVWERGLRKLPTSQSLRKSTLNIHWKDWCWSSNTLTTCCEELTHWKRPWCWEILRVGGEGGNRLRWLLWLNGHEFEQTLGDSEGQGSLACCSPWGCKESDTTERLNSNNKMGSSSCVWRWWRWRVSRQGWVREDFLGWIGLNKGIKGSLLRSYQIYCSVLWGQVIGNKTKTFGSASRRGFPALSRSPFYWSVGPWGLNEADTTEHNIAAFL